MEATENNWISITEYSSRSGVSISTIRRKIKKQEIKHTSLGGKYYIYDESFQAPTQVAKNRLFLLEEENKHLKNKIKEQVEEIGELRMLVTIYESGGLSKRNSIEIF